MECSTGAAADDKYRVGYGGGIFIKQWLYIISLSQVLNQTSLTG